MSSHPHPRHPLVVKDDDTPDAVLAGTWRLAGTRVPLSSIGYALERGEPIEQVAAFLQLTPEQAEHALAFLREDQESWREDEGS